MAGGLVGSHDEDGELLVRSELARRTYCLCD